MSASPMTLLDAATAVRAGTFSCLELTTDALERADALDGELGVYLRRFDEHALSRARAADADFARGIDRGPLQGIPIGVKDVLAVAEGPTTAQSLVVDPNWGLGRDARAIARLKQAGAVITGKLTTMELAAAAPDPEKPFPLPRNPWDPQRWAGGSSSGSGAGIAAGMMLGAVGTDTGGSVRVPAAFCGVSGLKPTFGRVPVDGSIPLSMSLDHVGPLARSAADCGALFSALAALDGRRWSPPSGGSGAVTPLDGLRVGRVAPGVLATEEEDPCTPDLFDAAAGVLHALGATVIDVELPHYDEALAAAFVISLSESYAYHRANLETRLDDFARGNRELLPVGARFSRGDYLEAQRTRRTARDALVPLFGQLDALVMPVASVVAPTYSDLLAREPHHVFRGVHTVYWSVVGYPALAVPMGMNAEGLPLGLQIVAPPDNEQRALEIGDAYQRVTDWHLRTPPVPADGARA